jgi:predicted nucleic acid-binding protein
VLVAELLRERGRALFVDPRLRLHVASEQWSEFEHEFQIRLARVAERGALDTQQVRQLHRDIQDTIDLNVFEIVQTDSYHGLEEVARRRIPRDPNDWPTVALAIALNAGILTSDHDFLGCGCATWTFETLRDELLHIDPDAEEESARQP